MSEKTVQVKEEDMMFKKISIFLAAVMLVVMGAGLAVAAPLTPNGYGSNMVDGMVTGIQNGAATNAYINPGGLGDALIYGYYNVRSDMGNLFTVTNTSTSGTRARIRFLEAKRSCEVIDFDICLSAKDVWTGIILNNNGVGNLTVLDADTSIDTAAPRGTIAGLLPTLYPGGINFRYGADIPCEEGEVTKDDTLEGYFIVIAENQLAETNTDGSTCGVEGVNGAVKTLWDYLQAGSVGNVLYGNDYSVDLTNLNTYAYNATAIADFTNGIFTTSPIAATPTLNDADDRINGLNFILTKSNLLGSYYNFGFGTEMVVNFPTKKLTPDEIGGANIFDDPRVVITVYDTAENSKTSVCQLSPCPPSQSTSLPNEVNVISLNQSAIVDSNVEVPISMDVPYIFGWLNIDLVQALTGTPALPLHATSVCIDYGVSPYVPCGLSPIMPVTYTAAGLPAIGYVMTGIVTDGGFNWMLPLQYTNSVTSTPLQGGFLVTR